MLSFCAALMEKLEELAEVLLASLVCVRLVDEAEGSDEEV